ncbi:MAG: UDP-N-acetylmuramoyl-L-alanine--D-glutamate ligase [Lachnospiraceae bacterium]|nr:UDP-N-acetylmuramoyl-L-alanine--D-glutamate ligase [Lachnospiraceae bacterium]
MGKYLVFGLGRSGISAAEMLLENGQEVVLYDGKNIDTVSFRTEHQKLAEVPVYCCELPEGELPNLTAAVLSPGVPLDSPDVMKLKNANVPLSGELEIAYVFGKGNIGAITGTNGKTTTTSLLGKMLDDFYNDARTVGNIGIPYTREVSTSTVDTYFAIEVSSFQLETIDTFHPKASAILNITEDHLNRHHTMENYIAAKESIVRNQTKKDTVVLNYDDPVLKEFGKTLETKVVYFSSSEELKQGLFLRGDDIIERKGDEETVIINTGDLQILGTHNFENVMAAVAMGEALGVSLDSIRGTLRRFTAVEHRIEYVCSKRGVAFYNDSKGTNPDAAIKAVLAMGRPTVLIGGGFDKGSTYDEWVLTFPGRVKKLVLIGETAQTIAKCCDKHGFTNYEMATTLEGAVLMSYSAARTGDAVLLSPACASWDMFADYEERGREFKKLAKDLPE